jgi:hypothetical protein
MWGLDSGGLAVLDAATVEAFRVAGAFTSFDASEGFSFAEVFVAAFPSKPDGSPMSRSHLSRLAAQAALRWGPFQLDAAELEVRESTNQEFVVVQMGRRNRAMVFFES